VISSTVVRPGLPALGLTLTLAATLLATALPAAAQSELPAAETTFGQYELVPLLDDDTPYAGPATPTSLDDVQMTDQVDGLLDQDARAKLAEQGFVIVPEEFRLFHHAYDEQYYEGTPVFVTTDAAYHAWHQVFDKTLRDLEAKQLAPALADLLAGMRRNAVAQQEVLAGSALEEDAAKVVDLISVAQAALSGKAGQLSQRAFQFMTRGRLGTQQSVQLNQGGLSPLQRAGGRRDNRLIQMLH